MVQSLIPTREYLKRVLKKVAIRTNRLIIDFNNKDAIRFGKMKQLALAVNDIPFFKTKTKQWNYCNTTGIINDDEKKLFNPKKDLLLKLIELINKLELLKSQRNYKTL